jgi:autotransporter strand-loop-strand O-heptosyltransferase
MKVWETNEFDESQVQEKTKADLPYLVKIQSKSLGDQIGSLAAISEYAKDKKVYVICGLHENTFNRSYPDLTFLPYDFEPSLDTQSGLWTIPNSELVFTDFKRIHYKFDKPLIQGYAEQLGVENWERPKIDCFVGERPIKSKYVCFSMHSTAQAKHWNYPGGWDQLCRTLRKAGLTPVCIDRHNSFGNEGWWNEVPSSCVKKQGMNLAQMTNYIHHS